MYILRKEEKEKLLPQVVYLVQRKVSKAESESVVDKLFRTFQAAERYVLGQGAKPSGYYCYEDNVYKYEIDQMIMEVEE